MYDLSNPVDRLAYLESEVGDEIVAIKKYLEKNSFIAYMLAKKQAGKGTYATMLREVLGEDKISHLSVGDIVREAQQKVGTEKGLEEIKTWFNTNYSGGFRIDDLIEMLMNHEFAKYFPTGMIISLLEKAIHDSKGKALLIDGFPRTIAQIENTLNFADLIDYRPDPDFFVHIECPEEVILERYKGRRVCSKCGTSRNISLLPTPTVSYDEGSGEYVLHCDNPSCNNNPLVKKEADDLGYEAVAKRNSDTQELMDEIKKFTSEESTIILRNVVPVKGFDEKYLYTVTKYSEYVLDKNTGAVSRIDKEWIVKDDDGTRCYSYYAAPVIKEFIKQLAKKLAL